MYCTGAYIKISLNIIQKYEIQRPPNENLYSYPIMSSEYSIKVAGIDKAVSH